MTADRTTMVLRRRQAAEDQVRVAYGAVPAILEELPTDHPARIALRDRARLFLVEWGYLTAEELGTLPVEDAIAAARRRLRDDVGRVDLARGGVPRSGRRSAGVSPRAAAMPLGDKPAPV